MIIEEWRPVPGWEQFYEVSNRGRLRSMDREVSCGGGRRRVIKGRLRLLQIVRGYRHVILEDGDKKKNEYVHRLVLLAFRGQPKPGMQGCHNDGQKFNNHLDNLRWDTLASNKADMVRHGTSTKGERNPNAKLSLAIAQAIRRDRAALGWSYKKLARKYSISTMHAYDVCAGKYWSDAAA
jgi:hypothetical protein